jgi:hypothetical protein
MDVDQEEYPELSTRECLILAQAIYEFGSNKWAEVSNVVSQHPLIDRPDDFFSPEACEANYLRLMKDLGHDSYDLSLGILFDLLISPFSRDSPMFERTKQPKG